MKLCDAFLRVSVENIEQFRKAVKIPEVRLIYIDAGFFAKEDMSALSKEAHKGTGGIGKLTGLRLPRVWRTKAEEWFGLHKNDIRKAGFDCFLCPSIEGALWLKEEGFTENGENIVLDHSVYCFNSLTGDALSLILSMDRFTLSYPLELSSREMQEAEAGVPRELTVYGRAPMMTTAQCIRKTELRCDRRASVMMLKDRTGALMPVKNNCTFCYNVIYNSVPTAIFDLADDIERLSPSFVRYEFTTESPEEMVNIIKGGQVPAFTRGHFRKGVL